MRRQLKPERWIPNADIREYYQYWLPDLPDDCGGMIVGHIKNYSNENIDIAIEIDDPWMLERHQRNCTLYVDAHTYVNDCTIVITKEFFDEVKEGSPKLSFLWHEVGHFHTNHLFPDYIGPEQSSLRKEYINKGEVYPAELVADLVAAYYAGKDSIYEALRQATRERHRLNTEGDTNASMAWWELRRRKSAIKKGQTEEEIEAELCRLCNVSSIELL